MEYQKIMHLLDNTPNQPCRFKAKNWVEVNNESRVMYKKDNQIRFETSMLRSSLCDYGDAYILVKGTITVAKTEAQDADNNGANKKVILKNCAPFTNCINKINNTQVDSAHDIDVVMQLYNLIEYSDNYSKTYEILWQYCRDEPAINAANGAVVDFTIGNSITDSFKIKEKTTGQKTTMAQKMLK